MVTILDALILGIVQGLAEWLPISSSGHLVLAKHFLGITDPLVFEVMLHLASMFAVAVVFREKLLDLAKGALQGQKKELNYIVWLALATFPIALVGIFFKDSIEAAFGSVSAVGFGLLLTAVVLFVSYLAKEKTSLSLNTAIIIGLVQSIAIFPGVSRSGMTISVAMLLGIAKKEAAEFSFLLSMPAILGATVVSLPDISRITEPYMLFISMITCFIVSILALKGLLAVIQKGKWWMFGIYCLILGMIILVM